MIDRVQRLPRPEPNVGELLTVLRRGRPGRVPLLELKLDDEVMSAVLGEPFVPWSKNAPKEARERHILQTIGLWHRLGYDAFRLRTGVPFTMVRDLAEDTAGLSRGQRAWQDEHAGPIGSAEELEAYAWPTLSDVDFGPVEEILAALPDGMGLIGFCGGVFEWSSWLMGLERFMLGLREMPEVVRGVVDRVGQIVYDCLQVWAGMSEICALWLGDDLGFKTGTLIAPQHIREYILPWYCRYTELAHRHGKPFILHSCGNLKAIMPDLADDVGIDARHSFEDVIQPVEEFARQWHGKVAAIGGLDVDILARGSEQDVIARTKQILEACAPLGGYAAGSGNSITNYVTPANYLAMIETVHRFNGRR